MGTTTNDDEWIQNLSASQINYTIEEEPIHYGESVVTLSVFKAALDAAGNFVPELVVLGDGSDLLYDSHFIREEAWAELDDNLTEDLKNQRTVPDAHAITTCRYCGSGIRANEVILMAVSGEIQLSHRMPSGNPTRTETFRMMDADPTVICLGCENVMHQVRLALWDGALKQHLECEKGTSGRCWRYGCPADKSQCIIDSQGIIPWIQQRTGVSR